jgi:hypothetical protein
MVDVSAPGYVTLGSRNLHFRPHQERRRFSYPNVLLRLGTGNERFGYGCSSCARGTWATGSQADGCQSENSANVVVHIGGKYKPR